MEISNQERQQFLETLWAYFARNGRNDLPWRLPGPEGQFDPYQIMVSELMLQQTQAVRVIPKYHEFLRTFPDVHALAAADLGDVLRVWQGLGYNRRAKFLWQAAQILDTLKYFPKTLEELVKLPGIGKNTAGAILAYAYNLPALFVETNVRTVYIHHFFAGRTDIADKEIGEILAQTLDGGQAREFYWALMDYGTHLKATVGNANIASRHYAKQSRFHGSRRQVRGQALRLLSQRAYTLEELSAAISDERLAEVLAALSQEGMVRLTDGSYTL
ncbi:MAG TPA: hypothetical protein VLF59_05910 [Candidatus Saccharimonadales bacterium]|nr:hypothetical protein [Candidatus Saccharimonadales bacterium]